MTEKLNFRTLAPDLQVSFFYKLKEIRSVYLNEALKEAVRKASISEIDAELNQHVSPEALKRVATFGVRGEILFPVPVLLRIDPFLLGYYRLLYGFSQKEFYKPPFSRFRDMEDSGAIPARMSKHVPELCLSLIKAGELLVENIDKISLNVVHELQLLTYGPLLRGSHNTTLGSTAEKEVKDAIRSVLSEKVNIQEATRNMRFSNSAGEMVQLIFSGDPDVSVFANESGQDAALILSVEIKGGTDSSNIHNRLGEAEKSHIKAKNAGFEECWTIMAVQLDFADARKNTPTTDRFFYMADIKDDQSKGFKEFKKLLLEKVGL